METLNRPKEGKIWAIAGGKGGTGKTFIISCVGTHLARKGNKVVLVDFDYGGANLHSFLGIGRPKKSLTQFIEMGAPLQELLVKTDIENMSLITGDIHSIASDSIKFSQKLKLFRQIMKLNSQYVLIDLGAGSHNNTLDTFLIADKMIAVMVPELIAIENVYHFLKNALYRKIKMSLRAYGFKEIVQHLWERREKYGIKNLKDLIDYLKDSFSYIGSILEKELANFEIYLVLNIVRSHEDLSIGYSIKSVLMKYLGVKSQFAGYIEYDDSVWRSIRERKPFMVYYSLSRCANEIETFAENLIQGKEVTLLRG